MIPFLPFIFLCMVAAGGLSVTFYSRREINAQIFPGMGFRIGALAGLFGFLMDMIIVSLGMLSAATRANLRSEIANQAQQAIAKSQDPATTETLRNLTDKLSTTQGLVTLFLIAAVFYGFFFVVFSGIGGALGAYLFGHRKS